VSTIANELLINEKIKAPEVRLVDAEGQQLGIMSSQKALEVADEHGLDLVMISPAAQPPVCKLMDYGKYRFEQEKHAKENRKNQKVAELKEIRLSSTIEEHDVSTKANQAAKFLAQGNKIKVSIRFRGRQMAHTDIGLDVMSDFAQRLSEVGVVDKKPNVDGRFMTMIVAPKPTK